MKKVHNFCAGPCILPKEVFEKAAQSVLNFNDTGLSILEISHRSEAFVKIIENARILILELLGLDSSEYTSLFLHGGASTQFLMVAQNLAKSGKKAGYLDTGTWSSKAIKEANLFGDVNILATSSDKNYNYIPKNFEIPEDLSYIHYTSNNTIYGTQINEFPENQNSLKVVDMSSDILSRNFNYSQFDLIYAGAQKNIGPAGCAIVVVKKSIIQLFNKDIPSMLNYKVHIDANSMFNTPPVYSIYVAYLNLNWLKKNKEHIFQTNLKKAELLYHEIDNNPNFKGIAAVEDRSLMNITFTLENPSKQAEFDQICMEHNIVGIHGHRSVGGYRASLYNALGLESVEKLVKAMQKLS